MNDDVLAEPRLDMQLLKCNPEHQMFPLPNHHHLTLLKMQLFKTQLWQLSPTLLHTSLSTHLNTQLQMLFVVKPWPPPPHQAEEVLHQHSIQYTVEEAALQQPPAQEQAVHHLPHPD